MAIADTPTTVAKTAIKKEPESGGRAGAFPKELKKLQGMITAFGEEFSFTEEKAGKILTQMEIVIQASRLQNHRWEKTLDRIRACSNTAFGGKYSKYLKASTVLTDDDREFLKEARQI